MNAETAVKVIHREVAKKAFLAVGHIRRVKFYKLYDKGSEFIKSVQS